MVIEQIHTLLTDCEDREKKYLRKNSGRENIGFNAFALMSDIYYRENFHSDVLRAILDINECHGAGNKYLTLFISLLNSIFEKNNSKSKIPVDKYFNNVAAVREEGRIDITIYGEDDHVIIIENKINNAGDTKNQIPNYARLQLDNSKKIDAIVYLTLNQYKDPDRSTWAIDQEVDRVIQNKLISLRTYTGGSNDLCRGFIEKCIEISDNIDALSILRQYLKILKHLTRNMIDHNHLTELMNYLKVNPAKQEIAISLKESIEKLPWHILTEIYNHFNRDNNYLPFQQVANWKDSLYYFHNYKVNKYSFTIDISMDELSAIIIDFSTRSPEPYAQEPAEIVLNQIGLATRFTWNNERYEHKIHGQFIEFADKAIDFLSDILKRLKENEEQNERELQKLSERKIS